jgi:D-alanyl-D-alanine carboxypeptidase/D-alanyl-D-alanine-endopeptidase (penicillin-binding protein 4)
MLTFSIRLHSLLSAVVIVMSLCLSAQTTTVPTRYQNARKSITENLAFSRGDISWSFRDIETGQELDAYQSKKLLVPASTVKLFTTGVALQKLGNFYRFETLVMTDGTVKKHQLKGDLIIKGGGDPSLGSGLAGSMTGDSVLYSILKMLKDSGITKIKGDLIIDPYILPYNESVIPRNYIWEDIGNYYGAAAWGLNWRNNEFAIEFTPGKTNSDSTKAAIVSSWAKFLKLEQSIKNSYNNAREIYVFSAPFSQSVFVEGETLINSSSFTERASLPDPPKAFGLELKQYLIANNIEIGGELKFESRSGFIWLRIQSPMLHELAKETNFKSNNLFAEAIAKRIAFNQIGQSANPTGDYLTAELNSYKPYSDSALSLVDGSGLSRNNQVCTAFQSQFLRTLSKNSSTAPYFIGSIPKVGEEGTMKNFPKIENMRAKSGSMNKVRSYAGYFYDKNNHWISFSIIANNVPISQSALKSQIVELLSAAAENAFELPLPFASYSTYTDTLNLFPEIIELKKDLVLNPRNYFEERDSQESSVRFTFRGEPTVEDPYFYVNAEGGGILYMKKFLYRFHAQTRFAERWNTIKNEWEMICWGDIFMTKK